MTEDVDIRDSAPDDRAAIDALYPRAFPEEDLLPLVTDLLRDGHDVLSLVATAGGLVLAHVAFTFCGISGADDQAALLGPLAVAPDRQRQGIGGALIRAGLQRLRGTPVTCVFVLGDPAYYGRFGFLPKADVTPPYPLPAEWRGAWQSLRLRDGPVRPGMLTVPPPWREPALWAP